MKWTTRSLVTGSVLGMYNATNLKCVCVCKVALGYSAAASPIHRALLSQIGMELKRIEAEQDEIISELRATQPRLLGIMSQAHGRIARVRAIAPEVGNAMRLAAAAFSIGLRLRLARIANALTGASLEVVTVALKIVDTESPITSADASHCAAY